jgi:hypothetical protein
MLQISTGKLFRLPVQSENKLRGILYTNLHLDFGTGSNIEDSLLGKLLQTSELGGSPKKIVYEFIERIEARPSGPQLIVSHGADSYLSDMAMLISLFFNCTCSPDIELVNRLIGNHAGTATGRVANMVMRKVFDKDVFATQGEQQGFVEFYRHLMGLNRKVYLGVMRAIRTYVTGLHRIADDLELSYTLMVAAGESLTQEFDGYSSNWLSVSEQKRRPIDESLKGVDVDIAERVRAAILSVEHVSLGRRFQAFIAEHVSAHYFAQSFEKYSSPPGRDDLPELLESSYKARSSYIHQLLSLPDCVAGSRLPAETVIPIGRRGRMFTLNGLARLVRDVIIEFTLRQSVVDREIYDYTRELSGVSVVRFASEYWIADVPEDMAGSGRDKLEAFLEQFSLVLMEVPDASLTDISGLLRHFLSKAPQLKKANRLSYWVMLLMFNDVAGQSRVRISPSLAKLIDADFSQLSIELMLVLAYFGKELDYSLDARYSVLEKYWRKRGEKSGVRFPRLFEAAIGIQLAEAYRLKDGPEKCREILVRVAENFPENEELRNAAFSSDYSQIFDWKNLLLPRKGEFQTTDVQKDVRRVKHNVRAPKRRRLYRKAFAKKSL